MRRLSLYSLVVLALLMTACVSQVAPSPTAPPAKTATPATVVAPSWETDWNKTLAAARQEGRLMIYADISPDSKDQITKAFQDKFGIQIEWLVGRANEVVAKVLSERRVGIFQVDILHGGTATLANLPASDYAGLLTPMGPQLVLPEVTDVSKWSGGHLWWVDREQNHIAYFTISMPAVHINTDMIKPGQIKSYNDLLDAKWKGQIVMDDPSVGGPGNSWVTAIGEGIMNQDYLRKLAKQEPIILRDYRQETEWVARGKNPVGVAGDSATIIQFKRNGAPIDCIVPAEGTFLSHSKGGMSVLDRPPHPNAAKVYANFVLSKEGQTIFTKAEGLQSARVDVSTETVDPSAILQPNAKYFNTITFDYQLKKGQYATWSKEVFGALIPK